MHKHFSDWYREIGIVPTPELVEKRWQAIEMIFKDIDEKQLLGLVCTLKHGGHCFPQFHEQFAQYFLKTDTTFPMRKNDNEIRVLSGACLAEIFAGRGDFGLLAAACTISGSLGILSSEPPYSDVTHEAADKLALASSELRARNEYPEMPSYGPTLEAALQDLKAKTPANNLPQVQLTSPLIDCLLKTENMVIELAQKNREFVAQAQYRIETLAEECNVLWWMFSGHSHDLEMAFAEIDKKALPIIAGKELSDLIVNLPGPASVKAILIKAIQFAKRRGKGNSKCTISEAIESLPSEWRASIAEKARANSSAFPCIFPLHFAITLAVDLEGSPWEKAFIKKSDIFKPELELYGNQIAYQFYLESLILQHVNVKR
jgi:hypothetical protein